MVNENRVIGPENSGWYVFEKKKSHPEEECDFDWEEEILNL